MAGTKRIPLARRPATLVTPRAVELFVAMGKLRCTCNGHSSSCEACDEWWRLHDELHDELCLKPHEWPCVARQGPKARGTGLRGRGHRFPHGPIALGDPMSLRE